MTEHAYALRDEYKDTFAGGSVAHGAQHETVDIKALLEDGGGVVLTADPVLQTYFEESDIFKRVGKGDAEAPVVGEGADAHVLERIDPAKHKLDELLAVADEEIAGHGFTDASKKADIAEAINTAREERAEEGSD